jgi:hypothetical protein
MKKMKFIIGLLILFSSNFLGAIPCDCHVQSVAPIGLSSSSDPKTLKVLEVEEFSTYSNKNYSLCMKSCVQEFQEEFLGEKLNQHLRAYAGELMSAGQLGTSCAFPLELKFPIKVKAVLGSKNLGSVENFNEFIIFEVQCF